MRWLGFFLRLLIIVGLTVWLVSQPGTASVSWHGYLIQTSAAFLGVVVALIALTLFQVFKIWRWVMDGPKFWRLRQKMRRMQLGQEQITKGLVAIASGNAAEAGRLAVSARKLLGTTTATRLLQAQAAQLAGDHKAAREIYTAMALDPESSVLGYRGLIMAAVREGNWIEAEKQVDKLGHTKPDIPWLNLIKFEIATRRHQWSEASQALSQASAARLIDQSRVKRHQAALFIAASEVEAQRGNPDQALQEAERALRQAPDWLPAMINLAGKQLLAHHVRTALRTIERSWKKTPHPKFAELYQAASKGSNPLEFYKHMERLARSNKDHPVSQRALAEAALSADLWGEARRYLMALASESKATQGVYRLLARLERRESADEQLAAQWLLKASEAGPDPRWLCSACGGAHDDWHATCAHCGGFNMLDWQTPCVGRTSGKIQVLTGSLGMSD